MTERERKHSGDLAPRMLLAASAAGALSAAALSGIGLAGSLIGAAIAPLIVTFAREFVLRVWERAPRVRGGGSRSQGTDAIALDLTPEATRRFRAPRGTERGGGSARTGPSWWRLVRWRRVIATAALATGMVIGAYTVTELLVGGSVLGDRRTTFFTAAPAPRASDAPHTPASAAPSATPPPADGSEGTPASPETATTTVPVPVPAPAPDRAGATPRAEPSGGATEPSTTEPSTSGPSDQPATDPANQPVEGGGPSTGTVASPP
ncbi:MAG TPA: hypothetical protein PKE32_07600 [Miltoncostaeaceae bacterium]|nr:hypothetical protein [Miltoncostaeaceae bacterium]